jgi:hypothetical protein
MIKRFGDYITENQDIVLKYYAFDWDDNLLCMPTQINMDFKVGDKWLPKAVSTEHFAEIRENKESWRPSSNAFIEFSDEGPRGENAFLEDMKSAIGGVKSPELPVKKAPSWEKFIECLEGGSIFAIITARGHNSSTIRKGVEWIIDNYLSDEQKKTMYNNCLSFYYIFDKPGKFQPTYEKISKHPLISSWLDQCGYYGVSSPEFLSKHASGGATKPEQGKEIALKEFIDKVANFARELGVNFKFGFSDDDPKNSIHIKSVLSEIISMYPEGQFSNIYTGKGAYEEEEIKPQIKQESTHSIQAPGTQASVVSFSKFNNMASRLFPANTQDNDPVANTHRLATDFITTQSDWTNDIKKPIVQKRKKNKLKK